MIKWRLMLTTLPYAAALVAIKLGLDRVILFEGVVDFSDIGLVLTIGAFLMGFMLSGTMSDFKESERLPADVACTLEAIEETFVHAAHGRPQVDLKGSLERVADTARIIDEWLHKKRRADEMYAALTALGSALTALENHGAGPHATRGLRELSTLRRFVTRIGVISRTGFLASGYALLDFLVVSILGLVMVARFKNLVTEVTLVFFVGLTYVYMVRLIRDIDDPFEYHEGIGRGAAEVDLFPLTEYRTRLEAKISRSM
jgi:hypothetical protein